MQICCVLKIWCKVKSKGKMINLDLAKYHQYLKMIVIGKKRMVFDPIRKSNFIIQPEELVRQSWIQFILKDCGIPESMISVERKIKLFKLNKRFDMVIYQKADPYVLFEFKSFTQVIDNHVTQQIASYNMTLKVPYLVISNGIQHFAFKVDHELRATTELDNLDFLLVQ